MTSLGLCAQVQGLGRLSGYANLGLQWCHQEKFLLRCAILPRSEICLQAVCLQSIVEHVVRLQADHVSTVGLLSVKFFFAALGHGAAERSLYKQTLCPQRWQEQTPALVNLRLPGHIST